ncbi:MAG: acetyl-CoA carboxylase biotin carboxylase subunit family protein [Jatrophihabitantaceae bacterium]
MSQPEPYLLLFGAEMSLRERALVAALRVFPGPVAVITPSRDVSACRYFDIVLDGVPSDPASALAAVTGYAERTGRVPMGVVPFADPYLTSGWTIADHFALPYLSQQAVQDSSINKGRMKRRFVQAGVPTPRHLELAADAEVEAALAAAAELGYPCVVKPAAFGGSLGVCLARDQQELRQRFDYVRAIIDRNAATFTVPSRGILLEQLCRLSREVSVEVLNHGDRRWVLAVTDKALGPAPYFAEMGHLIPSRQSDRADLGEVALAACAAIGLDRGIAHVEVRFEDDQPPQVIEVGARTAGDGIPDLMEAALGIPAYELQVRSYLDCLDEPPAIKPVGVAGLAVIKAPPGRIRAIRQPTRLDPAITNYELHAELGAISEVPQSYLQREGYLQLCWPGAQPAEIAEDAHLAIADDLAGQLFEVEPP